MVSKYIIPTLAVISGAYAQCSSTETYTLNSTSDATTIAGCTTYNGDIAIAEGYFGDLNLGNIATIVGSFTGGPIGNLTTIEASSLQNITGNFTLSGGANFQSLTFPVLSTVGGVSFTALGPAYQHLGFGNLSNVGSLTIIDTFLQDLSGITLDTAGSVNIAQNQYLNSIDLPLTSLAGTLSLSANANGQANASFPKLLTAQGINIQNVAALSMPVLANITGPLFITENNFATFSAPTLTSSTDFTLNNNNMMTTVSMPKYQTVNGAINIRNNSDLTGGVSFPALTSVSGSVYMLGDFSGLSMPDLNTVLGIVNLTSSSDISSTCSHFTPLGGNVVHGSVTCNSGSSDAASPSSSSGSSPTQTGSRGGGSSSGTSSASPSATTGAAAFGYQPSQASAYTVFGMLAAFFGLMM